MACDVTKIGSVYRNIKLTPTEHPADIDVSLETFHHTNHCCFLKYRSDISDQFVHLARVGLLSLLNRLLGKEHLASDHVDQYINNVRPALAPECQPILTALLSLQHPPPPMDPG